MNLNKNDNYISFFNLFVKQLPLILEIVIFNYINYINTFVNVKRHKL